MGIFWKSTHNVWIETSAKLPSETRHLDFFLNPILTWKSLVKYLCISHTMSIYQILFFIESVVFDHA